MTALAILDRPATDLAAAIATASTGELQDISAGVEALRAQAKKLKDRTLEVKALTARALIERRFGVLIRDGKAAGTISEGAPKKDAITLYQLGLSLNQSSHYQQLAALPDKTFEFWLKSWETSFRGGGSQFPTNFILAQTKQAERQREAAFRYQQADARQRERAKVAFHPSAAAEPMVEDADFEVVENGPAPEPRIEGIINFSIPICDLHTLDELIRGLIKDEDPDVGIVIEALKLRSEGRFKEIDTTGNFKSAHQIVIDPEGFDNI
ncbi:hypothetical protein [Aestuariivirga sp.]|uniref:hypothetical protein n=1 Tax=Aestuariivirga sp. TaxID=2650926 RepID=UPI003593A28C